MLKSLFLENFRNYQKYSLNFQKTTIIVGPNGAGKTNILEAIYLLSAGRSWRTNYDREVVRWGSPLARISAKLENQKDFTIEMAILKEPRPDIPQLKIIKINHLKKKLTDLLGKMPAVLFSPEEIQMVEGPPALRRRFLDILLCQVDKKYTLALLDLGKIIRGRNRLLYYIKIGRSKVGELAFWDEKLVALGSFIIRKRQKLLGAMNLNLNQIYGEISGNNESFNLKYKQTVAPENFRGVLESQRAREIENTATLFGPHRDDLVFLLENKDITTFGSRGEYRSAILALKIAELEFLRSEVETEPILLLDDIFSELDKTRRSHLGKLIAGQQTIITTTDLDHIERGLRGGAKVVELAKTD